MKRVLIVVLAALCMLGLTAPVAGASAKATTFANCTAMHKKYAHGVGRHGAHDHTSGKAVTNFYRNTGLYNANKKSDRDKDGIACEQA